MNVDCQFCTSDRPSFAEHSAPCIHRLPSELTSRIFISCLDTPTLSFEGEPSEISPTTNHTFRLTIGRICKRWRNISISTPQLWDLVELYHMCLPPVAALNDWLGRSGGLPLHISLFFGAPWYLLARNDCMIDIMTALGATIPRWESFHFHGRLTMLSHLRATCSMHTSILKNFSLNMYEPEPDTTLGFDLGPIRPSPSSIRFHNFRLLSNISKHIKISWNNVTQLEFFQTNMNNVLVVLALTPALRTCVVTHSLFLQPRSGSQSVEYIVLPHLPHFTLLEARPTILEYCTISTNCSRPVTRDANCSFSSSSRPKVMRDGPNSVHKFTGDRQFWAA